MPNAWSSPQNSQNLIFEHVVGILLLCKQLGLFNLSIQYPKLQLLDVKHEENNL